MYREKIIYKNYKINLEIKHKTYNQIKIHFYKVCSNSVGGRLVECNTG